MGGLSQAEKLKERKIPADLRPSSVAALVPTWGLEATLEFARKLFRSAGTGLGRERKTGAIIVVPSGEAALGLAVEQSSIKRVQAKDPTSVVGYKLVEPVLL